jgi:hypothetical protein
MLTDTTHRTAHLTRREVREWALKWPCFGEPRALTFEFASNGDLVDIEGDFLTMDEGGLAALADDVRLTLALGD